MVSWKCGAFVGPFFLPGGSRLGDGFAIVEIVRSENRLRKLQLVYFVGKNRLDFSEIIERGFSLGFKHSIFLGVVCLFDL